MSSLIGKRYRGQSSGGSSAGGDGPMLSAGKRTLVQQRYAPAPRAGGEEGGAPSVQDAAERGVATPSSPLPHAEAIQRSFGHHDVSSIEAHTGPEAAETATEMGAQAYATGHHVVLGGGADLFTVAHEAAHVVQQRAGVQLRGGVGQAGDPYERQADEVASLVVRGESAEAALDHQVGGAGGGAAVQRQPIAYHRNNDADAVFVRNKTAVEAVAAKIDSVVSRARDRALDWRNLREHANAHVKKWSQAAEAYFGDPSRTPDFIHARFGYAIETMACAELGAQESGLTVRQQVSTGATRPDIVLLEGGHEVAWIDITSQDSLGHIFAKDHAGWKNRPFVYEVPYKALVLEEVLTGTADPVFAAVGGYMARKNQIRYDEETGSRNLLRNKLVGLRDDNDWQTGTGNRKEKRDDTRRMLETDPQLNMDLGSTPMISTRGALAEAGVYDGPFGFKEKGGTKEISANSAAAKQWVRDTSDARVTNRTQALDRSEIERVRARLAPSRAIPLVNDMLQAIETMEPSSQLVERAIAVETAVDVLGTLRGARGRLERFRGQPEAREPLQAAVLHIMQFPTASEFERLQPWARDAVRIAGACDTACAAITARPGGSSAAERGDTDMDIDDDDDHPPQDPAQDHPMT